VEGDEVAAPWRAADLGDERLVAGLERRRHALGRDPERLGDEGAQREQREHGHHTEDERRVAAPLARGGLLGRVLRRARRGGQPHRTFVVSLSSHRPIPVRRSRFTITRREREPVSASMIATIAISPAVVAKSMTPTSSTTP
jgi:hypothetical protein